MDWLFKHQFRLAPVQAVTPDDIRYFVSRLLESKPSLALHGPGVDAVSYDTLLRRYVRARGCRHMWPL
jgi:fermentation-respiration switch protein FrsA (DUF1100 family)